MKNLNALNLVSVAIPVYTYKLTDLERGCFIRCIDVLKDYPIHIITHRKLDIDLYIIELEHYRSNYAIFYFDESCFRNIAAYNKLLMSAKFYRKFHEYKYILISQLDSYIFRDELAMWCQQGYDYIGAPWVLANKNGYKFDGVGNGGLSLRKVSSHLKALQSFSYIISPKALAREYFCIKRPLKKYFKLGAKLLLEMTFWNNTYEHFNDYRGNEDVFWGKVVAKNFSWFHVAPAQEALQFSMELEPGYLYKLNNDQLPFGCHAWQRYDPEFWIPHIIIGHLTD